MAQQILFPDGITNRVKIVTGEIALDGSNPTNIDVAGKLSTIIGVTLTLLNGSAPGLGVTTLTYSKSGTVVSIQAWEATGIGDPTLTASTDTETVSYLIIGY